MIVVMSGEGPTDLGISQTSADQSEGQDFLPGPMAWMVDRIIDTKYGYSIIDTSACVLVSKRAVVGRASKLKAIGKKGLSLRGAKKPQETLYHYRNARALAAIAHEVTEEKADDVVAVLFHDADDKVSGGRGDWKIKRQAVLNGFEVEGFARGVPMIPIPISEAWLICALSLTPYKNCDRLEERSGSKRSPNPLKAELKELIGVETSREVLAEKVFTRQVDVDKILMPSFISFKIRLLEVLP